MPRYLIRDRDGIYGDFFQLRVKNMGIEEVRIAPKSPWQNPYCERVIGSIRRECLDHCIILSEDHLYRILKDYMDYYNNCKTHLSLKENSPEPRDVQEPEKGKVVSIAKVGGLHHLYKSTSELRENSSVHLDLRWHREIVKVCARSKNLTIVCIQTINSHCSSSMILVI